MVPTQTSQIIVGIAVALLYGGAVMTAGILFVMAIVPQPMRTAMRTQVGLPSLVWLGFVLGQGGVGVCWLVLALT